MNNTAPKTVADSTLPLLVTLRATRDEAYYQWKNAPGEHKHKWTLVLRRLDDRIAGGERILANHLGLLTFDLDKEKPK